VSALASLLEAELDRAEAAAASVAWNKLLLVNLSALLLSSLPPQPLP
jgi:hypothetical protein